MKATSSNDPRYQTDEKKTFDDLLTELNSNDIDIIDEEIANQRYSASAVWYSKYCNLRDQIQSIIEEVETLDSQVLTKNKLKKLL